MVLGGVRGRVLERVRRGGMRGAARRLSPGLQAGLLG